MLRKFVLKCFFYQMKTMSDQVLKIRYFADRSAKYTSCVVHSFIHSFLHHQSAHFSFYRLGSEILNDLVSRFFKFSKQIGKETEKFSPIFKIRRLLHTRSSKILHYARSCRPSARSRQEHARLQDPSRSYKILTRFLTRAVSLGNWSHSSD